MMSWSDTLIKTLAIAITPVKVVDKGIEYTKQEVKNAVEKVKILGILVFLLLIFTVFFSVSIALLINYFSDSIFLGFIIISAAYFLTGIILVVLYWKHNQ